MKARIVDAGPLLFLARLNRLELLHLGVERVLVPSAVLSEVRHKPDQALSPILSCLEDWLETCTLTNSDLIRVLPVLGMGERETIAQALVHETTAVVLDDLDARRIARRLGLEPIGTVGLLLGAKKCGFISSLKEELERLKAEGFWISRALWDEVLKEAGEGEETGPKQLEGDGTMEVHEPPASYAEYCLLPEDGPRYEIVEGVGYLTPAPGGRHQKISLNILLQLARHVNAGKLGEVFDAPFDVVLSEKDVVQPDILFLSEKHHDIVRNRGVFGPPDLVVEILSASNALRDLHQKLGLYQRFGVREYWIVDEENRTVDIWTSRDTPLDTRRVVGVAGTVASVILPGFEIPVAEVFAGVERIPLD